jgi:hypothetical protein
MLEDIKSEEFTVLKGTSLELEANGQRHTLQVIEVRPYDSHSERPQPPFSVVLLAARAVTAAGHLSAVPPCPRRARSVHGAIGAGSSRHALRDRVQLIRSPFEKMIDAAVFQQPETEAAIEPLRGVERLDMERHRSASHLRVREQGIEESRPDALAALLRQERDVHDADLMRARVQIQPPDRLASALDDQELGMAIVFTVMGML